MFFKPIFIVSIIVTVISYLITMELPTPSKLSEISNDNFVGNDIKIIGYITLIIAPILILGLAILPFVLLNAVAKKIQGKTNPIILLSLSSIIVLVCYLYMFYSVFWFNDTPDALDGILLFIFPILAIVFAAIASAAARIWAKTN